MKDKQHIQRSYDALAHKWAEAFADEHRNKPGDLEMLRFFSSQLRPAGKVLDMACGPGNTSAELARLGVDVRGMDLSMKFVEEAGRRHPSICFERGDMLDLAEPDESLAGVVCFYGIIHFEYDDLVRTFDEVHRVLEKNGVALFTWHVGEDSLHLPEFLGVTVNIDIRFHSVDSIAAALKHSGFEQIALVEREPYAGVEYASRRAYAIARKN